ncbi:MAG: biopolymer transporter ExbD [Leptospiraceae bacterium]|nr:biopolymer transporter ExbD [Leptospiraceae bacterium]MDW8307361.1 biopolymer transporter ExbD [Leptospiraceae bacterium]
MAAKVGPESSEGSLTDINVIPLVDIMLVIIIILMVTAEFTKYRTVPVQLPKINAAAIKKEPQKIALTIKKGGELYFNDKRVNNFDDLPAMLRAAKQAQPQVVAILRAEDDIPYSQVVKVLDEVKLAGIAKVGLAVDAAKPKGK